MNRLLIPLLALLLLFTGCSAVPQESEEPARDWAEFQQEQAQQQEKDTPDYPDAFSMAYHQGHTLDPITCGEGIQQDVSSLLFEPIFRLDATFSPEPLLCTGYSWDESGLVCTLTVREGVLFSDGSSLTPADVADTLRRAAASPRYAYRLREVTGISSSSRSGTVTVTLAAPNQGFPALLDIPVVKSGTEGQSVPVGTGPYVFVTASEGDRLLPNSDWWQGKSRPVASIELVHAKDLDTAMHLFSSHRVELLTTDPTGETPTAMGQPDTADRPTAILQFIGFNTRQGIFADAAARSAFSRGIQRDMLVDAFLSGHAQAAYFPISPISPLYPADLVAAYDYEETLTALQRAGQSTGQIQELTLLVNEENSFRLANAQFIAENLSLLDWHITVRALPWAEYLAALAAGDFDLYYGEARLTADWDLRDLVGTAGLLNYGGYTNPLLDAAMLNFAGASDRTAAARRLCILLREEVPIAPICFQCDTVLTHAGVVDCISPTPGYTFAGLEKWAIHLS